ncbi:MAG TPA: hypothetical protein VFY59_06905 [Rubrobacter sp.]|nr:hypothetical protein [Rubrobacter sp.]
MPKTTDGWIAVGLAVPALVLTVFFPLSEVFGWTFLRPGVVAETGSSDQYPILILAWILSAVLGGVFGLISVLRSQERSIFVRIAMVPMVIVPALPIAFLVDWLSWMLRHEVVPIVPAVLLLVGMMALIAASHFVQRHSERYGPGGTISSVASFVGFALILVGALIGIIVNLIGVGLWAATVGLAALAIVTLRARVVPWWGGVALIAANPLLVLIWLVPNLGGIWLVVVPMLVAGFAVFLAARRRTERPARVR